MTQYGCGEVMRFLTLLFLAAIGTSYAQLRCPSGYLHCVELTWKASASGGTVTGYNVKRATISGGPYYVVQTTSISGTFDYVSTLTGTFEYIDILSFTEGATYYYVITAMGPGGESAPSNEASAKIPFAVPGNPSGATATVTSGAK